MIHYMNCRSYRYLYSRLSLPAMIKILRFNEIYIGNQTKQLLVINLLIFHELYVTMLIFNIVPLQYLFLTPQQTLATCCHRNFENRQVVFEIIQFEVTKMRPIFVTQIRVVPIHRYRPNFGVSVSAKMLVSVQLYFKLIYLEN